MLGIAIAIGPIALRYDQRTAADDRAAATVRSDARKLAPTEPTSGRLGTPTKVERVLAQPASLDFDDALLKDFGPKLAAQLHVNVLLDRKALAEANIPDEVRISLHCHEMPPGESLRQALSRRGLGFITLAEDTLEITTEENAAKHEILCIYDVRDLVGYYHAPDPYGRQSYADFDSLIDVITSIVAPSSWDSSGGAGQIAPYLGCLFIPQTEEVQDQIGRLLIGLRKARDAGPNDCQPIVVDGPRSPLAAAIDAQLDKPLEMHFPGGKLPALEKWLKQLGIPSALDDRALADQGSLETALDRLDLHEVVLGWALRHLLNQHQLDYLIVDDGLVITTQEEAGRRLECVVYPLGILANPEGYQVPARHPFIIEFVDGHSGAWDPNDGALPFDLEELVQTAASKGSWNTDGGPGSIAIDFDAKALVCDQTHEAQKRIARVLAAVRVSVKQSGQMHGKSRATQGPPPLVVSVYHLSPIVGNNRIEAGPSDVERYAKIIRDLIEPRSWNDGTGYIAAIPSAIVVRQTPAVQEKIRVFLIELGALGQIGGYGAPVVKPPKPPAKSAPKSELPDTTKISNGLSEKPK